MAIEKSTRTLNAEKTVAILIEKLKLARQALQASRDKDKQTAIKSRRAQQKVVKLKPNKKISSKKNTATKKSKTVSDITDKQKSDKTNPV